MTDLLWLIQRISWINVIDILLVATILFWLLYLVRGTQAVPVLRGVILLLIVLTTLGSIFPLRAFSWLVQQALPALLIAVPVIFQPELRRMFERVGRAGVLLTRPAGERALIDGAIGAVVHASRILAERRYGALMVFERETGLQEYVESGVQIYGDVTVELLTTLFDPHTVLHDGAVIIRGGRIAAAASVMPLSTAFLADRRLGLRHRAALGITEGTDAIAVVVSEERGSISIAHNGRIIRNLSPARLETVLRAFYQPVLERGLLQRWAHIGQWFRPKRGEP